MAAVGDGGWRGRALEAAGFWGVLAGGVGVLGQGRGAAGSTNCRNWRSGAAGLWLLAPALPDP